MQTLFGATSRKVLFVEVDLENRLALPAIFHILEPPKSRFLLLGAATVGVYF
jgi:hypothetical protein